MTATDIPTLFSLLGLFLIMGFIADLAFKKIGIPDLLILIGLGILTGPMLRLIDPEYIRGFMRFLSTLAIAAILFDGGLSFDLKSIISGASRAVVLALSGFALSIISVAGFSTLILGWNIHSGVLLGVIVGGTSSAVTIPMVTRLSTLDSRVTSILTLESILTDVFVVVVGLTLMKMPLSFVDGSIVWALARETLSYFSIGCLLGITAGLIWSKILEVIYREVYRDILTLSVALLLYGLSEILGGSGPIASLSFGLALRNIGSLRPRPEHNAISMDIKTFQSQISFLMRTFLFVSIGVISVFDDIGVIITGLAISMILVVARYLAVKISLLKAPLIIKLKTWTLTIMMGRGLAAASMASLAFHYNVLNSSEIYGLAISVILFTVIFSSIGAVFEKLSS